MLDERTKLYIENKVADVIGRKELPRYFRTLEQFFELARSENSDTEMNLREMANIHELDIKPRIKAFTDIEKMMKTLFKVVDPARFAIQPPPLNEWDQKPNREWTLAYLYRFAFEVIPEECKTNGINLKSASEHYTNYSNEKKYGLFSYYLAIYYYRNDFTHTINDYTGNDIAIMIKSYLIAMLDLCDQCAEQLEQLIRHKRRLEQFDMVSYCREIVSRYRRQEEKGFGYINTKWFDPKDENQSRRDVDKLIELSKKNKIKLTGEAGTGKSTALRRIEYLFADRVVKNINNSMNCVTPVYIELCNLANEGDAVLKRFASVTGIEENSIDDFLLNEKFCLLLDGYNEVLDSNLKRQVAFEVDRIEKKYPKIRIFLSDRTLQGTGTFPVLNHAKAMKLSTISLEDKKEFFRKNCQDKKSLEIILEGIENEPDYFGEMDTPLKLKELIVAVSAEKALPFDVVGAYLRCLIERERIEKKDENMNHMEDLLAVFALRMELEGISDLPRIHAYKALNECKATLGYSTPDTEKSVALAIGIGILAQSNNRIGFASEKYYEYFRDEAYNQAFDTLF